MHSQASALIAGIVQPLDAIPAADIHAKINQACQSGVAHVPVRRTTIVGHLDGHGHMVVVGVGAAPGAVPLVHKLANMPLAVDAIVRTGLPSGVGKDVAALLQCEVARHVVDGDFGDRLVPGAGPVGADVGVGYKVTVAHDFILLLCYDVC